MPCGGSSSSRQPGIYTVIFDPKYNPNKHVNPFKSFLFSHHTHTHILRKCGVICARQKMNEQIKKIMGVPITYGGYKRSWAKHTMKSVG